MTISCSQTFFPKNHNRRIISLQGTSNFRDVGGYRGLNRQKTSWGVLYRSADLAQLSSSDLTQLQALGLQISIDLRSNLERQMRPYDYPFLKTILCSVEPKVTDSVMAAMMHGQSLSTQQADTFMHTMYEDFVFRSE